ncbi:hypothetical protein [Brachybacterium epidermidis]|uniref:hypothetical protein n=1 Tax=Brachybacterium epidermidis TaxID=2781983 RepID=UPI00398E96B8
MTTSIRTKALTGAAVAFLTLGMAACTNDTPPEPTPTVEPAPVEDPSDNGGTEPTEEQDPTQAAGACSLPAGDQSLPNQAPEVDEWVTVGSLSGVPVSETHGPEHRDGDLYTCYAHSPTGALFASVYAFAAAGEVPGFAENWVAPGEIQDEMREGEANPSGTTGLSLAGYRVNAASDTEFVVDLAVNSMTNEGQGLGSLRVTLDWKEDRWILNPSTFESELTPLNDLTGFTPWSANG